MEALALTQTTHLWLFFVMVFGIVAGSAVHVVMGAGVGVLLRLFPAAFNLMLVGGYLSS